MIVHVCERARESGARSVAVATDDARIAEAVARHGHRAVMTRADHASGTDRIAEAAAAIGIGADEIVVNVQGDEPLIAPGLVGDVAATLRRCEDAPVSTACHALHDEAGFANPNIVKVVLDAMGYAMYFSRAGIPYPRDGRAPAYRHIGIYGYRVSFLARYGALAPAPMERAEALEQLRVLWHGFRIAVTQYDGDLAPGVDTPQDLEAVRRMLA
jgi:3-deoxy-manno-octulosonate cytidylyltransferase (CMP-KDO synthetase)